MYWTVHLEGGPRKVNHAATRVGDEIFSFGGYSSIEDYDDVVPIPIHVLNTKNLRWSAVQYKKADELRKKPFQRYGHTVVAYDDKIYMWGGRNNKVAFKTLCCFDPSKLEWTAPKVSGANPLARDGHSACVINHKMYIFGGFENFCDEYSQDVHALDLRTFEWTFIYTTGIPPSHRDFHSATPVGDRMYVFGGRSPNNNMEEVYCPEIYYLDTVTKEWVTPDTHGDHPQGRRSHSAWYYNNNIFIFGGYNSITEDHFNDLYKFSPLSCKWTLLNIPGKVPCKRRRQACVLHQNKLYLFGGTRPHTDPYEELIDNSDLHVLDYQPTLKTLCINAVLEYKLDFEKLPQDIVWDIKSMILPNQISQPIEEIQM